MRGIGSAVAGILIGGTALVAASTAASAAIVCRGNVCWHVNEVREFPPEAGVIVHEDDWRWRPEERYEWREPEGHSHGYWRDGAWITIGPNR
jgi:hypothetical protein